MGSSQRPAFAAGGDTDVAPGDYDDHTYEMGHESKGFTIGEKRQERVVETSMGPGAYDPEKADHLTKTTVIGIRMDSSPGRDATLGLANSNTAGPGQYDDRSYDIANNMKSFTIGERRETKVVETLGPGMYSPEKADGITKSKITSTVIIDSSTGHQNLENHNAGSGLAPG